MKKLLAILTLTALTAQLALAKGKIQDEDVKSEAELISAGSDKTHLPNAQKVYVTANGINDTLHNAITNGAIGGGGGSGGVELLKDTGFEAATSPEFSNTGGTFTHVSSGPNLLIGLGSATFQASSSGQNIHSALHAVPNGLFGRACSASVLYKGGDANLVFKVIDGSSNVIAQQVLVASSASTKVVLPFICPSSGSIQWMVASTASSAVIAVDDSHMGENVISQVSQSSVYGAVNWPVTASCSWTRTSTDTFGQYTANASCTLPSGGNVEGNASAPATKIPAIKFASLPPGDYEVHATGVFRADTAGIPCAWGISDGTTLKPAGSTYNASAMYTNGIVARFSYTTAQSNVTFDLEGTGNTASAACAIEDANVPSDNLNIWVVRRPGPSQQAVFPELVNWHAEATQATSGGDVDLTNVAVGSYQAATDSALQINQIAGSVPVKQGCSSTDTPVAPTTSCPSAGTVSIDYVQPSAGDVRACVSFAHQVGVAALQDAAIDAQFKIVETAPNSQSVLQSGNAIDNSGTGNADGTQTRRSDVFPHKLCSIIHFSSAGEKMLRVFYKQQQSTNGSQTNVMRTGAGAIPIHWEITPITQNMPAPVFVGSIVTPSQGVKNVVSVDVCSDTACTSGCTSDPCAIGANGGEGVTSINRSAAGHYLINFAAGTFSSRPICTSSNYNATQVSGFNTPPTTSQVSVVAFSPATTALADDKVGVVCIGNK